MNKYFLLVPLVVFLFRLFAYYTQSFFSLESYMDSEYGLYENLTPIFTLIGSGLGIWALFKHPVEGYFCQKTLLVLFVVSSIYYAGEEVSWGQHFVGWESPELMMEINKQQETNLHNTHFIFDHLLRESLISGIVLFSVLIPVALYYFKMPTVVLMERLGWALPGPPFAFLAVILLLTRFPDRLTKMFPFIGVISFPEENKEFQEVFFGVFFLLMGWTLLKRVQDTSFEFNSAAFKHLSNPWFMGSFLILFIVSMRPIALELSAVILVLFFLTNAVLAKAQLQTSHSGI